MLLTTTVDRNSTACPSTKCKIVVGKIFDFFVTVASTLSQSFLWVAKMDHDVYLLQPNILGELLPLNRTDGYYGARCPVSAYGKYPSRGEWFMCGMFYAVTCGMWCDCSTATVPGCPASARKKMSSKRLLPLISEAATRTTAVGRVATTTQGRKRDTARKLPALVDRSKGSRTSQT